MLSRLSRTFQNVRMTAVPHFQLCKRKRPVLSALLCCLACGSCFFCVTACGSGTCEFKKSGVGTLPGTYNLAPHTVPQSSMEDQLSLHLKEYEVTFRAVAIEMQKVWQDLEVSESARQVALGEAMAQACHAWSSALSRCTQHRTEVADQISALLDPNGHNS